MTITDQATGIVAVKGPYTVTAQTPQEAVAAWRDERQPFAVLGVALAEWRLGDKGKAREGAQSLFTSSRFIPDVFGARLLAYVMAMSDHDYSQAVGIAQGIIDARRATASPIVQPGDYANLVNALIGACRLEQARGVLGEALKEYPNVPALTTLTSEIEKARQNCP